MAKPKKAHKKIMKFCFKCMRIHSKGDHRFHGFGSFNRTH